MRIKAVDSLAFAPASVNVSVGERVRFVVTNEGAGHHEFVLGNEEVQDAHGDGHHGDGEPLASLDLQPGETEETTVTFDEAGDVLYGCHVEGHYEAGMVGTVTVAEA